MTQFTISADDGELLCVRRWDAKAPARAVVQIAHGAAEHVGRYEGLAGYLVDHGYHVIAADHRGHGVNAKVGNLGDLGPRGFAGTVRDMAHVTEVARAQFAELSVFLLAHSFGSFAAQIYLMQHADLIDGLVLSGTAALDLLLADADLETGMTAANAQFEPARTPFDWLSRDEQQVDAYIADPLCGFELKAQSLATIAEVSMDVGNNQDLTAAASRNLPIYIICGEQDPIVGSQQSLSRALAHRYSEAGLVDVLHRVYPGGRHEMFNEINRVEVMTDLVKWLDARSA